MRNALVLLVFAVSACAQDAIVSAAQAACGPSNAEFRVSQDRSHPVRNPEEGKALVYVVLDQKYKLLHDVTARVGVDGAWVGANHGDSYLFFAVKPGEHHLCTDWTSWRSDFIPGGRLVSLQNFTAEAGQTYYFRAKTTGGRDEKPSLDLDPINSDEGKLLVASFPLSISEAKNQRALK